MKLGSMICGVWLNNRHMTPNRVWNSPPFELSFRALMLPQFFY